MVHHVLERLVDDHADLREQLDDMETQLEEYEDKLEELEAAIDDATEDKIAEAVQELDDHKLAIAHLSSDIRSMQEDLTDTANTLHFIEDHTEDGELYGDWKLPKTCIPDDEFESYAQDIVSDTQGELPWWVVVDWEATAGGLKRDYTAVVIEDREYWFL